MAVVAFNLSCAPLRASTSVEVCKVPVFYVTDRQPVLPKHRQSKKDASTPSSVEYGTKRLPEKDTISGLHSGVVEVCYPHKKGSKPTDWQEKGLPLEACAAVKPPLASQFNCQSSADLKGEFDSKLLEALEKCQQKELFVFVHGFNNSFNASAENAAELSYYTGRPVLLFSWPSAQKVYRYSLDECNNEWSQEHFNQVLEYLADLKKRNNLKISLVAHSMGNRLFIRGMTYFAGTGLFSDMYMVNPDFDAQTFVHYLSRCMPKNGFLRGTRGQFLVSRKDKALSVAEGVFGGYTRLGQGSDFTLSALTSPTNFSKVWGGHENSLVNGTTVDGNQLENGEFANDEKLDDKQLEARRIASIARAVKVVDVTSLDHGYIGHKVPHEYIAWMHNTNRPPEGYEINEGQSEGSNSTARFFARVCGQKLTKPEGKVYIVTKSTARKP